jgi:hypothetical protein
MYSFGYIAKREAGYWNDEFQERFAEGLRGLVRVGGLVCACVLRRVGALLRALQGGSSKSEARSSILRLGSGQESEMVRQAHHPEHRRRTNSKPECSNGQNEKESRMTRIVADY